MEEISFSQIMEKSSIVLLRQDARDHNQKKFQKNHNNLNKY